jgi:hypothetical protein
MRPQTRQATADHSGGPRKTYGVSAKIRQYLPDWLHHHTDALWKAWRTRTHSVADDANYRRWWQAALLTGSDWKRSKRSAWLWAADHDERTYVHRLIPRVFLHVVTDPTDTRVVVWSACVDLQVIAEWHEPEAEALGYRLPPPPER